MIYIFRLLVQYQDILYHSQIAVGFSCNDYSHNQECNFTSQCLFSLSFKVLFFQERENEKLKEQFFSFLFLLGVFFYFDISGGGEIGITGVK